jgi:hypothetical protein
MWKRLCNALGRLARRPQNDSGERRVVAERARFWKEVREGQREAEANSRP